MEILKLLLVFGMILATLGVESLEVPICICSENSCGCGLVVLSAATKQEILNNVSLHESARNNAWGLFGALLAFLARYHPRDLVGIIGLTLSIALVFYTLFFGLLCLLLACGYKCRRCCRHLRTAGYKHINNHQELVQAEHVTLDSDEEETGNHGTNINTDATPTVDTVIRPWSIPSTPDPANPDQNGS